MSLRLENYCATLAEALEDEHCVELIRCCVEGIAPRLQDSDVFVTYRSDNPNSGCWREWQEICPAFLRKHDCVYGLAIGKVIAFALRPRSMSDPYEGPGRAEWGANSDHQRNRLLHSHGIKVDWSRVRR